MTDSGNMYYTAILQNNSPHAVPNPDLKIRGRGKGGWWEGPVIKKVFLVLWASVWSKNKGERRALPRPSPGSATAQHLLELWQRFAPLCTPLPARTQQLPT